MNEYAVTHKDTDRIREIWATCFDDTPAFQDWFFANRYAPDRTLAYREGEEIVANVQMIPYTVRLRNKTMESLFIVGAATMPEARGNGRMGTLMRQAFAAMRERGVGLSHLYPFQYDFYRRHGFEVCCARLNYCASPQQLQASFWMREELASDLDILVLSPELVDIRALMRIYDAAMQRYDGHVVRDESAWQLRLQDHALEQDACVCLAYAKGEPCGYSLFARKQNALALIESLCIDERDLANILLALCDAYPDVRSLEWSTPPDDGLFYRMRDSRGGVRLEPHDMIRLVDIERAINGLECSAEAPPLVFEVRDAWAPWNAGVWELSTQSARMRLRRTDAPPAYRMDVRTLAQLASGYIDACKSGIQCLRKNQSSLDLQPFAVYFKKLQPFLFEMY